MPASAGSITRSVELAQQFGEVAVARFRRRRLEGPAERCRYPGMGWRNVHSNNPAIQVQFRRLKLFDF